MLDGWSNILFSSTPTWETKDEVVRGRKPTATVMNNVVLSSSSLLWRSVHFFGGEKTAK
jgi:hypothetical protein